jgi:hypothetical protein
MRDLAFGATATIRASDKRLLRVVTHIDREDRMTAAPDTIRAFQSNSGFSTGTDWIQKKFHASME